MGWFILWIISVGLILLFFTAVSKLEEKEKEQQKLYLEERSKNDNRNI